MKQFNNLLRSTDGADSTAVEADPLSTPVSDIDISRDVAKAANYEMTITEAKKVPKKDDDTKFNIMVKVKSTKEAKSTKGVIMPAGTLVLSKYYPIQASEKSTLKDVGKTFARLAKGVGLPGAVSPRDIIDNPSILVGKTGLWKVGIKDETSEFPEGNEIKDVVVPE